MRILKVLGVRVYEIMLNLISKWPSLIAILVMTVTIIVGTISRYWFNNPLHFVDEFNGYLMAMVTLLPLAYVLVRPGHIKLNLVTQFLRPRVAAYFELFNMVISLLTVVVLFIGTTRVAIESFATHARDWTYLQTPLGPLQLMMPIGLGLLAMAIVVDIARWIKTGGKLPKRTAEVDDVRAD